MKLSEKHYHKLVRDNIPKIITEQGKKPITKIIKSEEELLNYLGKKLVEEAIEYNETKKIDELVDVMEVIYSILEIEKMEFSLFVKKRQTKKEERGGFDERILLLKVIE